MRLGKTQDHSAWVDQAADTGAGRRMRALLGVTLADDPNGRPDYFSPSPVVSGPAECTCETDGFCQVCR